MAISIISIIFGVYVVAESLHALNLMTSSEKLCRRAKYVLAAFCGAWFIYNAWAADMSWLELAQAYVIVLFVWPKTVERVTRSHYWPRRRGERRGAA